jgi:hypothetical protein
MLSVLQIYTHLHALAPILSLTFSRAHSHSSNPNLLTLSLTHTSTCSPSLTPRWPMMGYSGWPSRITCATTTVCVFPLCMLCDTHLYTTYTHYHYTLHALPLHTTHHHSPTHTHAHPHRHLRHVLRQRRTPQHQHADAGVGQTARGAHVCICVGGYVNE